MKVSVSADRDRVVLAFGGRLRDLCIEPWDAAKLAEAIDTAAAHCERWMDAGGRGELVKGELWDVLVQSWDGRVNIRFVRVGDSGLHDRVSIPYRVAREIAHRARLKVTEARFRVHLAMNPAATNSGSATCPS